MLLINLCAETIEPVFEGDKKGQRWIEMNLFINYIL